MTTQRISPFVTSNGSAMQFEIGEVDATDYTPPQPGEVYALPEENYRYGIGPVLVHIVSVNALLPYHGEPWWQVTADYTPGTPERHAPGWRSVEFYLRAERLASARIRQRP
ncbi:hypothetical protein AB0M36_04525 [Actinoplanes sp. NPDC051346]|uniref:hypothetical protein n=1 Tax=Actinoplanes sp. NPDC051346 TaxID=3155048 RepID=UPI003449F118